MTADNIIVQNNIEAADIVTPTNIYNHKMQH